MEDIADVEIFEGEEVLFQSGLFDIAERPEEWSQEDEEKRTWDRDELTVERVDMAVVATQEDEVVIRLLDGSEYPYKRAIERCELGDDYIIPSMEWMVLISNQLPQKAAEAMGKSYKEGVNEDVGTDVRIVEKETDEQTEAVGAALG
jgi:hypothetical protein